MAGEAAALGLSSALLGFASMGADAGEVGAPARLARLIYLARRWHGARKVERYQQAGLDHFIALMQADRIPHEKVMRSIELFGKEIMPRFR